MKSYFEIAQYVTVRLFIKPEDYWKFSKGNAVDALYIQDDDYQMEIYVPGDAIHKFDNGFFRVNLNRMYSRRKAREKRLQENANLTYSPCIRSDLRENLPKSMDHLVVFNNSRSRTTTRI